MSPNHCFIYVDNPEQVNLQTEGNPETAGAEGRGGEGVDNEYGIGRWWNVLVVVAEVLGMHLMSLSG